MIVAVDMPWPMHMTWRPSWPSLCFEAGEHLGHEARAGGAERVAVCYRAAPRVDPVHVGFELVGPGEDDRREGFVDLDPVQVLYAQSRLL